MENPAYLHGEESALVPTDNTESRSPSAEKKTKDHKKKKVDSVTFSNPVYDSVYNTTITNDNENDAL